MTHGESKGFRSLVAGHECSLHRARYVRSERVEWCRYNQSVFFVYMVRCADGTLYTGFARDPEERARVHNDGKGAKYTRSRLPVALVYVEQCESLGAALKRERQLKQWSRAKKEALIAGDQQALKRA